MAMEAQAVCTSVLSVVTLWLPLFESSSKIQLLKHESILYPVVDFQPWSQVSSPLKSNSMRLHCLQPEGSANVTDCSHADKSSVTFPYGERKVAV